MSKRIKSPVSEPLTREQVETLVNEIALCKNNERRIKAEADASKLAIDDAIAGNLILIAEAVKIKTVHVQQWAEASPAEFTKRKSVEFAAGTIGFRTGTPKLKTRLKTGVDAVLEAMRSVKRFVPYIRIKEEINKEKILEDYAANILIAGDLAIVGLKVMQEEVFYIEPNLTATETRASAPTERTEWAH